ncbi:hypothetical protein GM658_05830 [Pseudoduganella eburnea]|uniref:Uncharacterized protein n=1 Tax=Massilia eburnea TaxID=1776165 RepID=A0A6L6QEN6_9BURK|nr:hypothetical protein [Massilia eburnea]MTW10116.1 hypothetical protein [Massilia eburnea]
MTRLPDAGEWSAPACPNANWDDAGLVPGQSECREFEDARAAFDVRLPETEERMTEAFQRFHQLGFDAFFQGATSVPMVIACRPQLVSMWMDGFVAARMSALARRCDCHCVRSYRWGHGYDVCPRREQALVQKAAKLAAALEA